MVDVAFFQIEMLLSLNFAFIALFFIDFILIHLLIIIKIIMIIRLIRYPFNHHPLIIKHPFSPIFTNFNSLIIISQLRKYFLS